MFTLSLRNSSRPVNKLPPEIISQIARSSLESYHIDPKPIVPLTHVCQYWRESIISAPENWARISIPRLGLTALSLERSKAAPLHLQFDMSFRTRTPRFCNLIAPHTQRIKTLRVKQISTIEVFTKAFPNFPNSMPNLRSLDLAHTEDRGVPHWDLSFDPFGPLPNTLTSLVLHDIPLYPSFLRIKTLTKLDLHYHEIRPALDTLLDLVEDNCSLESVALTIDFKNNPSNSSQRPSATTNRLRHLSVSCWDATTARTLISNIPLRRGAHLGITFHGEEMGLELNDILPGIPITHFPNIPSPTFMEYMPCYQAPCLRAVRLNGPNGSFSYSHDCSLGIPFTEFSVLPLTNIRELHLTHGELPITFDMSPFPALETLTLIGVTGVSRLFSIWLSDPSLFPSLKTLGFFECVITEEVVEELKRFASNRKNTTSAWLHHVTIVGQGGGEAPSAASIRELENHVSVVEVRFTGADGSDVEWCRES